MRVNKCLPIITLCAAVLYLLTGSVVHQFHNHGVAKSGVVSHTSGVASVSDNQGKGSEHGQTACLACYYVFSIQGAFPAVPLLIPMQFVVPSFHGGQRAFPTRMVILEWLVRAPPLIFPADAIETYSV